MKHFVLIPLVSLGLLAGCGALQKLQGPKAAAASAVEIVPAVEPTVTLPAMGQGSSAAALDGASEADKKAAMATNGQPNQSLGTAVVALGSPAEQGFWVKSPLVKAAGKGRVVTSGGQSVNVELRPGTGGALLSLSAFRALGLGLTDLPEVTIYAD